MGVQCVATFTMTLDLKDKPFITFRCEREAHKGLEHFTTGIGAEGRTWKMCWADNPIGTKEKGGIDVNIN